MKDLIRYLLIAPMLACMVFGLGLFGLWLFSDCIGQQACDGIRSIIIWSCGIGGALAFFVTLPAAWDERHFIRLQLAARRRRHELQRSEFTE